MPTRKQVAASFDLCSGCVYVSPMVEMAAQLDRWAVFVEYCADGARCPAHWEDAMRELAAWRGESGA